MGRRTRRYDDDPKCLFKLSNSQI